MLAYLKTKAAAALAWIYKWVTVLTGVAVAFVSVIPSLLNTLSMVDLSPLVGPDLAAQIVTGVALIKGGIEIVRSMKPKPEA